MSRKFFAGSYWFFEETEKLGEPSGHIWGLLPEKEIYSGKSAFQRIEIFQTQGYGRILALDDLIQLSTAHERTYHEMLVHPPALCHGRPKNVLIIGGGDGGSLREIVKYPVQDILLIDIDREVIEVSKKYLPSVSQGAFEDPRVTVVNADALEAIKRYRGAFDLIISDITDAYGPSTALWEISFFTLVSDALTEDGIASFQAGYFKEKFGRKGRAAIRNVFPHVLLTRAYVGCFPFDECAFVAASHGVDFDAVSYEEIARRFNDLNLQTAYYSPEIHFASTVIPKCCRED